jgi:peptide chain release factor 3
MTGFVFKIQANMDPNHRDRIAFMRVCSGKLTRGMKAKLIRTGKNIPINAPQFFFARDRSIADEAYAGDVVGLPNHGQLRIGDTLTEGEEIVFRGVPSFAPEILRRILIGDAMKAKKLREALQQLAEDGDASRSGIWTADALRAAALHHLPLDRIRRPSEAEEFY